MIELNQLKQLVCIYENKTISNAATILHISQPALSRSMQKMEEDLGVNLFDHYKNKIVLNKNGELAVVHAKKIIADMEKMIVEIQEHHLALTSIKIVSATPAPVWDLEPILKKLYNDIQIQSQIINQDQLVDILKNQKAQLAITPFEVIDKDIISISYLDEDLCLSIPKNHPLKDKKEVKFRDLDNETMLLYNNIGFWHELHMRTMPKTNFIVQEDRKAFTQIVNASTFPSFTTNLSIKREGFPTNRIIIPFDQDEAHVSYYINILKKDKDKFKELIETIKNYYDY